MRELDASTFASTLIESFPDMVYVVDAQGRLAWWNDRVRATTGYSDAELAGMDAFDLVPDDAREAAVAAFMQSGDYDAETTREFPILTKDGERIPHEFNGTVLADDDGVIGVVAIARDVSTRRARERDLRRQHDELETLVRISEAIYDVIQALINAATREELESTVCQRLAASDLYRAVWVGRNRPDGDIVPQTGAGIVEDFTEVVADIGELAGWDRPAAVALRTGELQVVQTIADSDQPPEVKALAADLGIDAGVSVPITHRETIYGVLTVYSARADAFSDREQAAFGRLGEIVGFATNAIQTERLLLSDTITELTLRVRDAESFLGAVSTTADGPCRHHWMTVTDEGRFRHYVSVRGLAPTAVVDLAADLDSVEACRHLGSHDDGEVYVVRTRDSLVRRLVDAGASPTAVVARDGETTATVEVPRDSDLTAVVAAVREMYDVDVVAKREVDQPVRTVGDFRDAVTDRLTDRQETVLRHAYFGGYFTWPRETTAEELAESLDISSATLHYHLRQAVAAFVGAYLDDTADPSADT